MPEYTYQLRLTSPAHPGSRKPYGHFLECHDYIPGSVIRGAVAEAILRGCAKRTQVGTPPLPCPDQECAVCVNGQCRFYDAFCGEDPILFGNGYPVNADEDKHGRVRPWPLTARECADYPSIHEQVLNRRKRGDVRAALETPGHGVWDVAISTIVQDRLDASGVSGGVSSADARVQEDVRYGARCPACRGKAQHPSGFYYPAGPHVPDAFRRASPRKRRQTHTAISRRRWAAEGSMLFSMETLIEKSWLGARLHVPEWAVGCGLWKALRVKGVLLPEPGLGSDVLCLGRGGNAGLGRCERAAAAIEVPPEPNGWQLADRITAFDAAVQGALTAVDCAPAAGLTIVVGATSDIVAPGSEWHHDPVAWLCAQLPAGAVTPEPLQTWLGIELAAGWDARPADPQTRPRGPQDKPAAVTIAAGSVFVLHYGPSADRAALEECLTRAEARGIGERREQGYGRIRACDAIHIAGAVGVQGNCQGGTCNDA